jgi:class 3 adenylate cyclase/tetratricopeptide (TPR) repeat protein
LFVDLVGFTAESDEADPEDVHARLVPYHQRVRSEIESYGGTVEKLIGDGVMAVFGVPTAHEDDPERAVRAALRIQASVDELNEEHEGLSLVVRIGINSGEAMVTTGGQGEKIVGDVVNTASRLESIAPSGGVVVGETTHRATELLIEYEDMDSVEVKGKSKPLSVWRAVEPRGRYGIDAAYESVTPFLGRESEMTLLKETFKRVLEDGALQLVTVAAPPGVGKSRLINEFWHWVDDQPEIVWWRQGRCLPYGEGITFWALGEIVKGQTGIRESDDINTASEKLAIALEAICDDSAVRDWMATQLGPLVAAGMDTEGGDRSEAFAAWRRFLEDLSSVQPLVMVVEDLHWVDNAFMEFLEDLLVWSVDAPIMVICTARPELYESHPAWGGGHGNSSTITLSPLDDDQIALLIAALLEQAVLPVETQTALLDRAEGNPLYAEEFVRMLTDRGMLHGQGQLDSADSIPVPETVQGLIGSRLDVLSESEARAIEDASVVGKVFWEGSIAGMSDHDDLRNALRGLVAREWIRPVRNSSVEGVAEYAFWHALTRDVAYGRIPRRARAEKHRQVAEWIEATAGERASDHAEMLAHHYQSALEIAEAVGDTDLEELRSSARRAYAMAGDRASRLDPARAADYYQQALDLMEEDDRERPQLLFNTGMAMADVERANERVSEFFEKAAELAESQGDRITAGIALSEVHRENWIRSGSGIGTETIDRAIELLEAEPPSAELAAAYSTKAAHYMMQGDNDLQLRWVQKSIEIDEELGIDSSRGFSIRGIGRYGAGDVFGGMDDLRKSLDIAKSSQTSNLHLATAFINLAMFTGLEAGPAAAIEIYQEGIDLLEPRGANMSWTHAELMWVDFDLGHWDELIGEAESLLERWQGVLVQYEPWAQSMMAAVHVWRGEVAEAQELHEKYLNRLREIEDPQLLTPALGISAQIRLMQGDKAGAVELIDEFYTRTEGKLPLYRSLRLAEVVRILVAADQLEKAEIWMGDPVAPGKQSELNRRAATAVLAESRGDLESASAEYVDAAAAWQEFGNALEEALAHYGASRCFSGLGRDREAEGHAEQARVIFDRLGAASMTADMDGESGQAAAL